MAGVAHDEAGAVVVHPTLAATHEQVRRLPQRRRAVQEGRRQRRRAVGRRRPHLVLVAIARHSASNDKETYYSTFSLMSFSTQSRERHRQKPRNPD